MTSTHPPTTSPNPMMRTRPGPGGASPIRFPSSAMSTSQQRRSSSSRRPPLRLLPKSSRSSKNRRPNKSRPTRPRPTRGRSSSASPRASGSARPRTTPPGWSPRRIRKTDATSAICRTRTRSSSWPTSRCRPSSNCCATDCQSRSVGVSEVQEVAARRGPALTLVLRAHRLAPYGCSAGVVMRRKGSDRSSCPGTA